MFRSGGLQQIENNQIEQNTKIISLLGRINSSLISIYARDAVYMI